MIVITSFFASGAVFTRKTLEESEGCHVPGQRTVMLVRARRIPHRESVAGIGRLALGGGGILHLPIGRRANRAASNSALGLRTSQKAVWAKFGEQPSHALR